MRTTTERQTKGGVNFDFWRKDRAPVVVAALLLLSLLMSFRAEGADAPEGQKTAAGEQQKILDDEFLKLGTKGGIGGRDWMQFDRNQIKYQIEQFIPPLLQPAFVGDAFVLPPNAIRTGFAWRYIRLTGDDFFRNSDPNRKVFGNFELERNLLDFDLFYGFDLNAKLLHSFTFRLNIPVLNSSSNGLIHPNGVQFIDIFNKVGTQEVGDIGLFLKKKIVDQGNFPVGIAVAFGLHVPTGKNDVKFGNDGLVLMRRPDPDKDGVQVPFDQVMANRPDNPKCFFANFNRAHPGLCTAPAFSAPASVLEGAPRIFTRFAFNKGVFGRFSDDGRLPATLQPGTGGLSYSVGVFLTRQFHPTDFPALGGFPGRSALHVGALYRFIKEEDGIDPGDKLTLFASYVKPLLKDYLAVDLTFVTFKTERDKYEGKIPEPEIVNVGGVRMFEFSLVDRPSFAEGYTSFLAPSIIISPDPQFRLLITGLFRVLEPKLGPAPEWALRVGFQFTF